MAIPKEPRQLMINIMYLVLTALLALNVSAEIFNAFKVVDSGLKKSSEAYDYSNDDIPALIRKGAKKKPELQKYADRIDGVRQTSAEFTDYVQEIIDYMIDQTGNKNGTVDDDDYVVYQGVKKLKGEKNKDITTRYLVTGDDGVPPKGPELKEKIQETHDKFLSFVDEADSDDVETQLVVDDDSWKATKEKAKRSWTAYNFRQMPLQATLPILNKFINDAKATESEVLNYLLQKVGTDSSVVLDEFIVISAPKKSYIIKGETYETELSLGAAASSKSGTKVSISVNGQALNVQDGKATWSQSPTTLGVKKYTATARVTNPVTNEVKTYTSDYEYEVGERSVTVSPTKMNVFYIGVENPVEISAAGVPSNQVQVSMSGPGGGTISKNADGTFTVRVKTPTKSNERALINVTAPGLKESREFRVKRIPNPEARLSTSNGGSMPSGTFKAQGGLGAFLDNFDFEANCQIKGFKLVYVPKRQDAREAVNPGGRYGGEARRLVDLAKPGDVYYFDNVKAECPGDVAPRNINTLVFRIK